MSSSKTFSAHFYGREQRRPYLRLRLPGRPCPGGGRRCTRRRGTSRRRRGRTRHKREESETWSGSIGPSASLLTLSLLFSLNSGRTAWRGPPPRIKFWHRLRSGRDRDLEDVLLLRPADLDLPKPPMRPKFLAAEDWREGGGRRPQRASRDRPFPFSLEGLLLPSFALTLFLLISLFSFFLPNGNGES